MNKGKLIKNIAIIVLVPTILVGAYYGGMYLHKKYKQKKDKNDDVNSDSENKSKSSADSETGSVDTTGMVNYTINIPFKLQQELFINGKFFNSISKINYSLITERVDNDKNNNPSMIVVDIMALPNDLQKLNKITQDLNKEILIVPTPKA